MSAAADWDFDSACVSGSKGRSGDSHSQASGLYPVSSLRFRYAVFCVSCQGSCGRLGMRIAGLCRCARQNRQPRLAWADAWPSSAMPSVKEGCGLRSHFSWSALRCVLRDAFLVIHTYISSELHETPPSRYRLSSSSFFAHCSAVQSLSVSFTTWPSMILFGVPLTFSATAPRDSWNAGQLRAVR